jgi:hypothetical protein
MAKIPKERRLRSLESEIHATYAQSFQSCSSTVDQIFLTQAAPWRQSYFPDYFHNTKYNVSDVVQDHIMTTAWNSSNSNQFRLFPYAFSISALYLSNNPLRLSFDVAVTKFYFPVRNMARHSYLYSHFVASTLHLQESLPK